MANCSAMNLILKSQPTSRKRFDSEIHSTFLLDDDDDGDNFLHDVNNPYAPLTYPFLP